MDKDEEEAFLRQVWESTDMQTKEGNNNKLLELLKEDIISGPVLQRPDFNRRFFLKLD
jgi:hypothetical protein